MTLRSLSLFFISLFILAACGGGGGGGGSTTTESPPAASSVACSPSTTNLCITVRETGGGTYGGNVSRDYVVQNSSSAGVANKTLTLNAGTYVFDQSGSTNASHPLRISTTNDGTHGGGSAYTTGVTTSGTPGTDGKTTIVINASTPSTLYYHCHSHSGMGGTINIVIGNQSEQVEFTETN